LKGLTATAAGVLVPTTFDENAEAVRRYWALDRTMVQPPVSTHTWTAPSNAQLLYAYNMATAIDERVARARPDHAVLHLPNGVQVEIDPSIVYSFRSSTRDRTVVSLDENERVARIECEFTDVAPLARMLGHSMEPPWPGYTTSITTFDRREEVA